MIEVNIRGRTKRMIRVEEAIYDLANRFAHPVLRSEGNETWGSFAMLETFREVCSGAPESDRWR
jgi:hypothetical protein